MKNILALAAVAVATVAGASTNYVEVAAGNRNLVTTVREMEGDPELADPAAFRAALEALDKAVSTGDVIRAYHCCSRRCPLTARAVLGRTECFTERVKGDILATCGYEAENRSLGVKPKEAGYVGFALQASFNGTYPVANARKAVLNAAAAIRKSLADGEIPFNGPLQNKLCIALGVEAYNAFVTEYNGK